MSMFFDERPSDSVFVEKVWYARSEQASVFTSTAVSNWEMVISRYQGRTTFTVRGPETKATPAETPPDAEFFGIVFKMGTFMPHLAARNLLDRKDITLPEATNQSFWLLGMAWEIPTYENSDTFVNRLVRDGLVACDPLVETVLRDQPPALSVRSIQRRFLQVTGMTYKTIQQIERAQRAAALLTQGVSALDVAFEVGYYDQSHLTNSLARFMGQTPAAIIQRQGQG